MNSEFLRTRGVFAAAIGAGILLGAAGVLLYQQLLAERRRLDRVASSVSLLRRELDHLKSENNPPGASRHGSRSETRSMSDMDMFSTVSRFDEEEEDNEFYDLTSQDSGDDEENDEISDAAGDAPLPELLEHVDKLLSGGSDDKILAYHLLHEHKEKYHSKIGFMWRLAKAAHYMGGLGGDKKKAYVFEGVQHAKEALVLNDKDADAHKWFAITLGSSGDFLSMKERIENGYIFKQHVDRAIALKPSDHSLHHLLGRFEFEVASLTWIERSVASTLFAAPPSGNFEEAYKYYMKAEELGPAPWKENRLYLAKCCIQLGNLAEAVKWLDQADLVPVENPEDQKAEEEIQSLLSKYRSYRQS